MQEITISEIQIVPIKPKDGLVAFASFIINNQFYIGDIAIYTRPSGEDYRLVYPSKILPNGKLINCVHPINRHTAEIIKEAVIKAYQDLSQKVTIKKGSSEPEYGNDG